MIDKKNKVAFLLKGSVSKADGKLETENSLYRNSNYINYISTFNSIKKHILDVNNNYSFDFFIHCWNLDLKEELSHIYNPVEALYEDNKAYSSIINKKILESGTENRCYSQVSQCLSINKGCELIKKHSLENNKNYKYIIIYRLDLLLWKDLILDDYEEEKIYANNYLDGKGDFHFVMNFENMLEFKNIFHYLGKEIAPKPHEPFQIYIKNIMKKNIIMDSIVAGQHQEVTRKIKTLIKNNVISLNEIKKFGLSEEEIYSYKE